MTERRYDLQIAASAKAELEAIHAYITARASRDIADGWLDAMIAKAEMLETFPGRGSIPFEIEALGPKDIRQIVVGEYRLIYRIGEAAISVIVVAHGRRDLRELLAKRTLQQG